jgi:circadian clock protein KaiC
MTVKALNKLATGIAGLDTMTRGGLPEGRCTLILGGPGSGKTVLTLQTLVNGARERGEPGIFVAFEERSREIVANASTFGWNIAELIEKQLFFLDARLPPDTTQCGQFDLTGILTGLASKAREMAARWIAFDAIDVLLSLLDNRLLEMRELYRLRDWIADSGLTGIITAKLDDTDPSSRARYSSLQFLADCVMRLEHRMHDQVSLREMRVVKYRGSSFAENLANYVLGPHGFEVANVSVATEIASVSQERLSSGIKRLDTMLSGGYYKGSTVLISGLPGTAKTTLACSFAESACQRGEKVLYIAFDEPPLEIVRNLTSVNIHLQPHIANGILSFVGANTDLGSSEEHLLKILNLTEQYHPDCLIVDPFSTLLRAGGNVLATSVARRLVSMAKHKGITLFLTSLQESGKFEIEANQMHISTIADTWIHVSYHEAAGERNRALSIIKSRGTAHSNQMRELILSANGVTLSDVYNASGAVLMGTLRWEAEEHERREQAQACQALEAKRRELRLALEDAEARAMILRNEIEMRKTHLEVFDVEAEQGERSQRVVSEQRGQLRGADSK